MGELVNLKRFKKRSEKEQSAKQADANRARFGRTKSERARDEISRDRARDLQQPPAGQFVFGDPSFRAGLLPHPRRARGAGGKAAGLIAAGAISPHPAPNRSKGSRGGHL